MTRGAAMLLAALAPALAGRAQAAAPAAAAIADQRILLEYGAFDPLLGTLEVPALLRADADTGLWIVQFPAAATDADRAAIEVVGGRIAGFLPQHAYVVRMSPTAAAACAVLREVRWVGPYHPAYRLERDLLLEHTGNAPVPLRTYNFVMADKRNGKATLARQIEALGGKILDRHEGSLLFTAELTGAQLLAAARSDEVLWVDRWTAPGVDMDNARAVQGSDAIQTAAGYTGTGVRGHVYEGVEAGHPDFSTMLTNVRSSGAADDHGHATAGCIFGNGWSAPQARGHAPGAVGFYTTAGAVTAGWSRNAVIGEVVNVHNCMFTTASWGGGVTTAYTSVSADADDIVFDHRIPWTNSMSNQGNQNVRPEAWAKNVISVGGLFHGNNAMPGDDSWSNGASIGPAADTRIKPDLVNFYESVWTSDRLGSAGYSSGNSTMAFGGTSAATPITAGLNALAIQMYTDHVLGNTPRVVGGSRFQNRPFAQTLKALQIACASLYPLSQATRPQAGWGYANVNTIYTRRNRLTIVPEDRPIAQGQTHSYLVEVLTGETTLKACLTWLDPAGNPAAAFDRVNDLNLRVTAPDGTARWGNVGLTFSDTSWTGGSSDNRDTVENVILDNPMPGIWTIEVTAPEVAIDGHVATAGVDSTYALVVNGGIRREGSVCARYIPSAAPSGSGNPAPFGTYNPSLLGSNLTSNASLGAGSTMFVDLTPATHLHLTGITLNTSTAVGTPIAVDVYTRTGTWVGNSGSLGGWMARTAGHGTAAALNTPSKIDFNEPFLLSPGVTGLAIVARNFTNNYTVGTGGNQNYGNADLACAAGGVTTGAFSGTLFTPRVPNLVFEYRTDAGTGTNTIYQTILRRESLGTAGPIRGLAFLPMATGRHFNTELVVRMAHVPSGHVLSPTFAANLPLPWIVFEQWNHSFHTTANVWAEIGFPTPFPYNGTSDVVVEVFARGNHATIAGLFDRATNMPRVSATSFPFHSAPTTASLVDNLGLRIRVNRNCAVGSEYGTACGRLWNVHSGTPDRGGIARFDLHRAEPSAALIIGLGFQVGSPFGTSLNGFGLLNCYAFHNFPVTLFKVASLAGTATHSIAVPNSAAYDGLAVHGQWFALDPSQAGGITASNYVTNRIGIDP